MTNLVGTTLGQYQIIELIGEGGMASVYKAWQPSLRRYVALKVLAPHLSSDVEFIKRFQQEAVSAANLNHTNIVTIHDVGTESGWHYIAMELIEGASLEERIRSGQAFAMEQVVDVISQVGSALDYAHQRSFIHRDIKPANILIDASGRAVLTDFGIVKALNGSGLTAALTRAGTVFGTPEYMSPEQITDQPLDHRSDLYALGIVCYEMLSGEAPFGGTTTHAIIYAQVNNPPPPLRHAGDLTVPAPVEAVVNKMLAKERTNRYYSAGEFARDLAQAAAGIMPAGISGETEVLGRPGTGTVVMPGAPAEMPAATVVQPTPTPMPLPVPAPVRRSRWPLVVGAVAMVLILAAVAVIVVGGVNPLESIQAALSLRSAQSALAAGDYAAAVEGFSQVLETDPDNAEAIEGQLEAAASLAEAGDLDAAIAAYHAVWQAKPEEVRALRALGQAYEVKGEWGEAARWYERWTQVATGDESGFLALGNARFNLGEHERAVAAYERAYALGADATEVDAHLGLAYFELAQYDKAVERLPDALSQNPGDFQLQRALGLAYYELTEYDKAVEHLQDAVSQDSEDFQLQRALGLSLYAQDQREQAAEHLNKAAELGADRSGDELVDVYYALGGCYFEMQDYEQAISFYEQAQELDPEGESVWAEGAQTNLDEAYSKLAESVMAEALLDLDFSNIVTEGDEAYVIARTGQRVEIEGPVRVVDGPWEESQALVVEEGTTNYTDDPILGKRGISEYTAVRLALARDYARARFGDYSLRVTPAATATGDDYFYDTSHWRDHFEFDNTTVAVSAWVYMPSGVSNTDVKLKIFEDTGDGFSLVGSQDAPVTYDQWIRFSLTATLSSSLTDLYIRMHFDSADAEQSIWVDGLQLEKKNAPTTVCYGDLARCSWTGFAHASTSTRTSSEVSLDSHIDIVSGNSVQTHLIRIQAPYDADVTWPNTAHLIWDCVADGNNLIRLYYHTGKDKFTVIVAESGSRVAIESSVQAFSAGDWILLVVAIDFSGNAILYIDGDQDGSGDTSSLSAPSLSYWSIGSNYAGDQVFNGTIAEYAVFDRALSAGEVAALYRVDDSVGR